MDQMDQIGAGQWVAIGRAAAAVGHRTQITRQAPSGIEGPTPAHHPLAAQQGLEPSQGGQGRDGVTGVDTGQDVEVVGAGVEQSARRIVEAADAISGPHVRVVAVDQEGVGMLGPHGPDQPGVGADVAASQKDRPVILDLADDQDALAVARPVRRRGTRQIVFAQRRLNDAGAQAGGAGEQYRVSLAALDQAFQPRGAGGVVVDALVIQRDRQGLDEVRAEAARTDEPVLHTDHRASEGGCRRGEVGVLLSRPDQQVPTGGKRHGWKRPF